MSSRFQAFGASVMGGLKDEESVRLPRGAVIVGVVFLVGAVAAIVAACLSLF